MIIYRLCLIIFIVSIIQVYSQAQNLVPNPSFELLKKRPCKPVTATTDNIFNYVYNWWAPTGGTSDIHTNGALTDSCSVNLSKYSLLAHSGTVCAGFFSLGNSPRLSMASGNSPYREYIQAKLSQPLRIGQVYYVEFYVSPFDATLNSSASCYSNNIGCYFSTDSIFKSLGTSDQFTELPFVPQINESQIINKPGEWYKISGCFTATEAARYITIGNFYSDKETKYIEANLHGQGAYYFVDDILVQETSLVYLPRPFSKDTTLCPKQLLSIHLPDNSQFNYQWADGSTASNYTIKQAGIYSLTVTAGPCMILDTFNVKEEVILQLPVDTTLCSDVPIILTPNIPPNATIVWNTGAQEPTINVTESGMYWVKSTSAFCQQTDSIRVDLVKCPGIIPNVFTPNGDGYNDTFFVDGITLLPWQLEIFNRWGSLVYTSVAYHNEWKGENLPSGSYYYRFSNSVLKKHLKGWVVIIR